MRIYLFDMNKSLDFSTNWNGKLHCKIWHTLRRSARFEIGDKTEVTINGKLLGVAKCISKIRYDNAEQIPETICILDTGYSKSETQTILKKMYAYSDPETMPIYGYLFTWVAITAEKTNLKKDVQLLLQL